MTNANLVLGVRKSAHELAFINNLNLDNLAQEFVWDFALLTLLLPLTTLIIPFLLRDLRFSTKGYTLVILSIEVIGVVIKLKPYIKYQ